jgi:ribonuclease P protein component
VRYHAAVSKSFAFPKSGRLTQPDEFLRVKDEGTIVRGSLLSLGVLSAQASLRAGFVTSKRVGNAVKRNRVRRRLREIFRHHQHELNPDTWVVTIARTSAVEAPYAALELEWLRLAKHASILAP